MAKILKIISIAVVVLGLLLTVSDLLDLLPTPKKDFAEKVLNLGENTLPPSTPYYDHFLEDMLYSKEPKLQKIPPNFWQGITIENLYLNTTLFWGEVYMQSEKGRYKICSFKELEEWANNHNRIAWTAWMLTVIVVIVGWIIEWLNRKGRKKFKASKKPKRHVRH